MMWRKGKYRRTLNNNSAKKRWEINVGTAREM